MKQIPLTRGKVALVDEADYPKLRKYPWRAVPGKRTWYAVRDSNRRRVRMHRQILRAPAGVQIDHANKDGLDNRRRNLRLATNSENMRNSRKQRSYSGKPTSSKYKGMSRYRNLGQAEIQHGGKRYYLGAFYSAEDAARARDAAAAAADMHGPFATRNRVPGTPGPEYQRWIGCMTTLVIFTSEDDGTA